jgi:hypothetical protein
MAPHGGRDSGKYTREKKETKTYCGLEQYFFSIPWGQILEDILPWGVTGLQTVADNYPQEVLAGADSFQWGFSLG